MKKKLYIKTALSLLSVFMLSSCLKESKYAVNFNGPALVELPGAANVSGTAGPFEAVGLTISSAPVPFNVAVNLAAPKPLSTPLTVKLSVNQAALTAYNHSMGLDTGGNTPYILLPAADYTSTLSVTIPAGKNLVNLVVNVNTTLLDPTQQYVLPLTITDGGGQQISNYNTVLYNIQLKNVYDGLYTANGFVFRDAGGGVNDPSLGGSFSGVTGVTLTTVSATTISFAPIWRTGAAAGGLAGTILTINPTSNAVTISSSTNATLANAPSYNNHYDPAKKIFYLSYKWGTTPSDRAETDTLTYTGSR